MRRRTWGSGAPAEDDRAPRLDQSPGFKEPLAWHSDCCGIQCVLRGGLRGGSWWPGSHSTVMCPTETTLVPFARRCPGPETAGGL